MAEPAPVRFVTKGDRELERAFKQLRKETLVGLRPALREAGEIVAREGRSLFAPIDPHTAAGFKVRVRARGVAVEQTLKRTTGLHPEWGALQMTRALLPALEAKHAEVVETVDALVDAAALKNGLL